MFPLCVPMLRSYLVCSDSFFVLCVPIVFFVHVPIVWDLVFLLGVLIVCVPIV